MQIIQNHERASKKNMPRESKKMEIKNKWKLKIKCYIIHGVSIKCLE